MDQQAVIAVVIPVYNQPQRLREVVARCLTQVEKVWVVDDGSDEPVAPLLEGLSVEHLRTEKNRGKGAALCHVAAHLREQGFTLCSARGRRCVVSQVSHAAG